MKPSLEPFRSLAGQVVALQAFRRYDVADQPAHAPRVQYSITKIMSPNKLDWFVQARYGMFIHFGVYSLLERAEWVLNRGSIPIAQYN